MYAVNAWSGGSAQESYEGKNLLLAVLDEIDAFRSVKRSRGGKSSVQVTAESMYDMATSSVQSRFPGIGRVALLSWPRYHGSFIMQRLEAGKKEEAVYTSGPFSTWDVHPHRERHEFDTEFRRNPERAKAKYMAQPGLAMEGYFTNTLAVLQTFNAVLNDEMKVEIADEELLPPVDWETMQVISSLLPAPDPSALYCWHIDLALRGCRAAVAMSHHSGWTESEDGPPVPVIDLDMVFWWEAPEGGEIQFSEIRSFVLSFARAGYRTAVVSLDGFQSQDTMQTLRRYTQYGERVTYDRKGNPRRPTIEAGHLSVDVNTKAYDTLKELIYEPGRLRAFYCPLVVKELLGLVYIAGGKKVDHLEGATKDASDAVAGSVFNAVSNLNESLAPAIFGETGPGAVVVGTRREGQWGIDDEQINIFDEMPKAIG